MKKRFVILGLVALLLLALAVPALAATDNPAMDWFKGRMDAKKAYVDEAVKSGQLTTEQGDTWKAHFDQMIQFHEQNGFLCPAGGPGRMGGGPGAGKWQNGNTSGAGMMRNWNNSAPGNQ